MRPEIYSRPLLNLPAKIQQPREFAAFARHATAPANVLLNLPKNRAF